jgi:hypothetical protein
LRDSLDRIIDARINVFTHQLHRHVAAALERYVRKLSAGRLLDRDGDDLIFLL